MEGWLNWQKRLPRKQQVVMSPTQDRDLHLPPNIGDLREPGLNELIANESIPLKGSAGPNPAISEEFKS